MDACRRRADRALPRRRHDARLPRLARSRRARAGAGRLVARSRLPPRTRVLPLPARARNRGCPLVRLTNVRRVAITGIGAVTPLGNDAKTTWEAALAGRSGVDEIRAFDTTAFPVRIAGEVEDFDPTGLAAPKDLRRLDRNVLFALSAAKEALADAGVNGYDPGRMGVVVGSGIGGFNQLMEQY